MPIDYKDIIFLGDTIPTIALANFLKSNSGLQWPLLVVLNLECAFGPDEVIVEKDIRVVVDADLFEHLVPDHLVINVANNHSMDNGVLAFKRFVNLAQSKGIAVIGTHSCPYVDVIIAGKSIRIHGCCQRSFRNYNELNYFSMLSYKRMLMLGNTNILFLHWGYDAEFSLHPSYTQLMTVLLIYLACKETHIIGHHSHTAMPMWSLRGMRVHFSIGNSPYWHLPGNGKMLYYQEFMGKPITFSIVESLRGYSIFFLESFIPRQRTSVDARVTRSKKYYLYLYFFSPKFVFNLVLSLVIKMLLR